MVLPVVSWLWFKSRAQRRQKAESLFQKGFESIETLKFGLSLSERDNPHLILPCRPLSFLRWGTICCSQTSRHAVRKRVKETGRQKDMMIQLPWGFTEHQSALPLASLQIYKRVFWKKNKDCKYRKDMKDHAFEPSDQISGAKPAQ